MPEFPNSEAILAQFSLLMGELLRGGMHRSKFRPWEIDLLLDIESCTLRGSVKRKLLTEYHNAVQAQLQEGADLPFRFSEYLEQRELNRIQRMPVRGTSRAPVKSNKRVR
jgi:hypothetical protein